MAGRMEKTLVQKEWSYRWLKYGNIKGETEGIIGSSRSGNYYKNTSTEKL
jgi:hypothetical protein